MAISIEMPKLSDTMEEGVLSAWLVDEGDEISAGDIIAQVETDKATMDLEAFDDGVLLKKVIGEGEAVPIGQLIAVIGEEGEDISDMVDGVSDGGAKEATESKDHADDREDAVQAEQQESQQQEHQEQESQVAASGDGQVRDRTPEPVPAGTDSEGNRIKASPLARNLAKEHSIDLASVDGSGPQGRIVKSDVEARIGEPQPEQEPAAEPAGDGAAQPAQQPAYQMPSDAVPAQEGDLYERENISQMRKTIARRLAQSKFTAPHFYLTVDLDMENVVEMRAKLNELAEAQDRPRLSVNDFITKACALALRQHPYVNASYLAEEGEIRKYNQVHVAVAVAIDEGLLTPVIRNADQKGLAQISSETRELAKKARNRELQPQEFEGSTFTTSNLGMFGIEEFTAIVNPPNAAILAIGEVRDEPVVKDGEVVPGKRMRVTLSCDHRVVDGAVGAQFLQTVRSYLEQPMNLML